MHILPFYILVYSAVIACASVGLSLHLRLVRFFDLSWTIWVLAVAGLSVAVTKFTVDPQVGILAGVVAGALLGGFEDGVILCRRLFNGIPEEVLERFNFMGALGLYLVLTSSLALVGLHGQEMTPVLEAQDGLLSTEESSAAVACWGLLILCSVIRRTSLGLHLRALMEDPDVCRQYGLPVNRLATVIGCIAGALTGAAASSYAIISRVDTQIGLQLMLLAVIPCIMVRFRNSLRVLVASLAFVISLALVRIWFGEILSEMLVYVAVVGLLFAIPSGFVGRSTREI